LRNTSWQWLDHATTTRKPSTTYATSTDFATTLTCSLILSRLDYCNSLPHDWQYLDRTACAEQCSHRPAGSEAIANTAVNASTVLAASSSQNNKAGCDDLQDPPLFNTGISQSTHQAAPVCTFPNKRGASRPQFISLFARWRFSRISFRRTVIL